MRENAAPDLASLHVTRDMEFLGSEFLAAIGQSFDQKGTVQKGYKHLLVWQRGIQMVDAVYELASQFPCAERFRLADQMTRASISVPSNIAEGFGRLSTGEFLNFLSIARGSNAELDTQIIICKRRGFGSEEAVSRVQTLDGEVHRLLNAYIRSVRRERT